MSAGRLPDGMRKKIAQLTVALLALPALALLVGCGGSSSESPGTGSVEASRTTTQVVVQTASEGFDAAKVYREASPGVVTIRSIFDESAAEGSGFVLDTKGRIVTNAHVVTDGEGSDRKEAKVVFVEFPDRNEVPAKIVGFDPFADVALLEAGARVVGINQQIETNSGANNGVGFAVPISAVKRSLAQLERKGSAEYAYVGVSTQALYPQLADKLGLDTEFGGLLSEVVPGRSEEHTSELQSQR